MLESLVICLFVTEYRVSITFPQGAAIFGELPPPGMKVLNIFKWHHTQ